MDLIFSDLTTDQTIWCKEWLETEGDAELNSLRLCLHLIGGQFVVIWNPMDALTHLKDWRLTDAYNYQYQKLGVFAKYGWTYFALNFKTDPNSQRTNVWAYMAGHDQCKIVSDTFMLDGPLVDDDKFLFCLGGTAYPNQTNPYTLKWGLTALVNHVYFLANANLERYHAFDAFGFQCHDYCQIGRALDQPKCLEDFETHVMHYWDFAPFRWYRPVWDYGRLLNHIPLGIPMDGQGLYTHHNGMWFDGGRTLVPNPQQWNIFSFTVDVWFKFYDTVGGTLIDTTDGAPRSWRLDFQGTNLRFQINGQIQTTPFVFNTATDYNKWFIAQASSARVSLTESKLGVKWNSDPVSCGKKTSFYDDDIPNIPNNMRIGNGFGGFIRKIKIYDYPKQEPGFELMYKLAPQCYKFHHTQTDGEICDIDYNFTCYTYCSERNEWDYDGKRCHDKCYTCSGNDNFHGFSCYRPLYIFHERGTCCPEVGGDGFFMQDSQYDGDDGNNNIDDGCNGQCLFEAGFTGINGSPAGPTVGTEIGGDGRKINHAGDDGGIVNGDGCDSNGAVEAGYQCTGGNRNTVDVGWEIGGDGLNYGNYPCDDGNVVAGDGGDASCTVELGWTCAGGSTATADTGTEIGGDGWRTNDAGDDKNTANGDGGDSTCAVEFGWMCGSEIPSICWKISQPIITIITHERGLISVSFNESVILGPLWTPADISMSISGPLNPYDLTYELLNATILKTPQPNVTIWFSYSTNSQLFGNGTETLTVSFVNQSNIINSAYNFGTLNSSLSVSLYPQESSKTGGELVYAVPIYFMMLGILGIGVISAVAGHSMAIAWQAMTIMQFVNFIPMTMIYSPSCMVKFGNYFGIFNGKLLLLLDRISRHKIKRNDFFNEINHKYIRSGYTSSAIIWNGLDLLIIWSAVLIMIPIAYGFWKLLGRKSYGFRLQLDKFRNAIIYVLMLYSYMRLTFLSMLNLRYAKFEDTLSWVSSGTAIVVAIGVYGYPLYEVWNVKQFYSEIKTGQKPTYFRLNILYSDFKVNHPLQYAYFWQYFLRRFLFVTMIIAWPQDDFLTLCLSTVMHMGSLMYMVFVLPFTSRTKNIAVMISEGGLVVIHGFLFPLMRGDPGAQLSYYHDKAFIFFLVVTIVIFILLLLIIYDSIAHVKKVCEQGNKEPEDEPQRILDSFSSSSLTEREVSLDSNEGEKGEKGKIEIYDPETEKVKIALKQKKKKEKQKKKDKKKGIKNKGPKPKTPPKKGDPLVSEFGRPLFKETQDINPIESSSDNETPSSEKSSVYTSEEETKMPVHPSVTPTQNATIQNAPTPQRSMFNPTPQQEDPLTMTGASLQARDVNTLGPAPEPKEEGKEKLFKGRDQPLPSNPMTPK